MTSDGRVSSRKTDDEVRSPPGFVSVRPFTLKWTKKDHEPYNLVEPIEAASKIVDFEKLQKSVKQRPWVLKTQPINLKKGDSKHLKTNNSVENTLPKGVILGGSGCQKVIARWRPEDACRPVVEYTPVFQPEEEFEDIFKYIAKIRPKAEEYGICRIIPPKSWKPPCLLRGTKFESSRFSTHVQSIDALKDLHSKRKLNEIVEQTDGNRRIRAKIENGSDNFEFKRGPEFTLRTFRAYAEHFKQNYFQKKDIFTDFRTPPWENIEGEYWRIVQHPTEEIQVLCGHNLEADLPSLVDDGQSEYTKSCWYLHNTPKLPGSLLSFDSDNTAVLSPRMDVGMCFSSICWKVEEHQLYSLSYMHFGASRIWYGVPSKYHLKCEALLKKSFPELAGHPELFHKLVTQLSPSTLKAEGIPVYRCVHNPKQFVLIFPGAYYSGFDTGYSVSEKVNLAPLDWLPHGQLTVETYSAMHRKTSISYDKLLMEGVREAAKSIRDIRKQGWNNPCGKDGWLTRALKSRTRQESFRREFLCNASQSRKMEEDFGCTVKRECIICFYDLYFSAASCPCSPDKYSCLEHSKQICACPWSSRFFLFRYDIDELNRLIDTIEGELDPKS
uniref:putative lysine-specific demethylase JMJ16 isoform X2 n=1 Tax=Erigeron canadensis TaxID=72917 RepID=UPI001CB8BCF9|nr:putative lysine-specific demethylase JMJ16 isoform X2 [Erigeron canadensis]